MYKSMIFFYILFALILIEIFLYNIVNYLKKDFNWIITSDDEKPKFNNNKLNNFYKNTYNKLLGWDRKKNSKGVEKSDKISYYSINKLGFRGKKKYNKTNISVFGDSFAFCRYVNDEQTWEYHLSKKLKKNVLNYGVGNYGIDQSFLKYKLYKKKLDHNIVIFNVVPETIARINSYWKHYREFGNILGFKPFFDLTNNKLKLRKNLLKKNQSKNQIYKIIPKIKKHDIFYKKKFIKNKFNFPYLLVYFCNIKFFSKIFYNLFLYKLSKNEMFYNNAFGEVLKKNIKESHLMYKNHDFAVKLRRIISLIKNQILKDKKRMILIITPQLCDLKFKSSKIYSNFYKNISEEFTCFDLTNNFKEKKNYELFFFRDKYGGHLNERGNKFIAEIIHKKLKKNKII